MCKETINRAFGQTPEQFSRRIDQTLAALGEETKAKRFPARMVLLAVLVLALVCGIAYALIVQGQEWYYNNRFTAYQERHPETYNAIMDNLQAVPVQDQQEDAVVRVVVQDAAWVPEEKLLTVSLAATPVDAQRVELHPMWNLDPDGYYVGPEDLDEYADDEEARAEHWLLTDKGFGPVRETMIDPQKALYLFEADELFFGAPEDCASAQGNASGMDSFVGEDGAVITVLENRMPWMDEDYDDEIMAKSQMRQERRQEIVKQYREARAALQAHTDANGMLTLSIPYTVWPYIEGDDAAFYGGGVTGWVTFTIRIGEVPEAPSV